MSQNLTQPEEIDRVLMEMARHDMVTDKPISDGALLIGCIHDAKRNWLTGVTGFSYSIAHKKPMHGLPDP